MNSDRTQVLSERTRIPADGVSSSKICIRTPQADGSITLKLSKLGSFDPQSTVRELTLPVENGEVNFSVYAPKRPGQTLLTGPGVRQKLEFGAVSHMQAVLYEWIPTLAWAIVLALVLRNYAVASYFIPSGSMESTLLRGDLLIADKFSYKVLGHEPQRGDVMIFVYPGKDHRGKVDYIKRIIGLPGDEISVHDGKVFVNGEALTEPYIKEEPRGEYGPRKIGPDEFFAMGDNRNHSSDSRVWGVVPRKNLEGRALFVFWPFNRAKLMQHMSYDISGTAVAAEK